MTTADLDRPEPVLSARGLVKTFGGKPVAGGAERNTRLVYAADHVDLDLRPGYSVALVGESGSGKSTVARLIAQLYPRTDGQVLLNGRPQHPRFSRARRRFAGHVQMVFQDPFASLNPMHRIRYQLHRVLTLHGFAGRGVNVDRSLCALMNTVQLTSSYLDKFPHELSGGQLQRVAIARALAARPQVLLADEPVSMLDVSIRLGILNLLGELKEREQLAILYITHDIASARYFAEETQVMYLGQIVEGGSSEEVTQRPAHPYTQLLIASAPDPKRRGFGRTPGDTRPLGGARQALGGRCRHDASICRICPSALVEIGPQHWVRRWIEQESIS